MRPYDDLAGDEPDYGDVALLVAGAREWPSEDFTRALDARVARRFAPEPAPAAQHGRGSTPRRAAWLGGGGAALLGAGVAAVIVLSSAGGNRLAKAGAVDGAARNKSPVIYNAHHGTVNTTAGVSAGSGLSNEALPNASSSGSTGAPALTPSAQAGAAVNGATNFTTATTTPVAPGSKQIRSAEITLTTANQHVDQVASEVFAVVGAEHGSVLSSHIATATNDSGGGYASFSLSIPTSNLQDAITQLARLHYAALASSIDNSQNVSHQYNTDQRQLADAKALRASLLKQLQTAYTQSDIDSIKAQLKLAEQQINTWQSTLDSLNHRISYSDVEVEINQNGLPIVPVTKHHSSGFTVGKAGHDALRVLVVSAGVALIALAVLIPVGLVAALLMWLWVWLRQRRREHALDATT